MAKPHLQQKAILMRKGGDSINSIAKKIAVSKSTVSGWCRDISLSEKQLALIAERSQHHATLGLLKASEIQRKKRQTNIVKAVQLGKSDVGKISKRDKYMLGLGLYWGEGYKKGSQELGFTNSDPTMITFYIEWLKQIYNIPKTDLILRISINDQHIKRTKEILKYWSNTTNISPSQFTKTSFIRVGGTKIYPNLTNHFGTLRVKVRRGTDLRRRILGSIEALGSK